MKFTQRNQKDLIKNKPSLILQGCIQKSNCHRTIKLIALVVHIGTNVFLISNLNFNPMLDSLNIDKISSQNAETIQTVGASPTQEPEQNSLSFSEEDQEIKKSIEIPISAYLANTLLIASAILSSDMISKKKRIDLVSLFLVLISISEILTSSMNHSSFYKNNSIEQEVDQEDGAKSQNLKVLIALALIIKLVSISLATNELLKCSKLKKVNRLVPLKNVEEVVQIKSEPQLAQKKGNKSQNLNDNKKISASSQTTKNELKGKDINSKKKQSNKTTTSKEQKQELSRLNSLKCQPVSTLQQESDLLIQDIKQETFSQNNIEGESNSILHGDVEILQKIIREKISHIDETNTYQLERNFNTLSPEENQKTDKQPEFSSHKQKIQDNQLEQETQENCDSANQITPFSKEQLQKDEISLSKNSNITGIDYLQFNLQNKENYQLNSTIPQPESPLKSDDQSHFEAQTFVAQLHQCIPIRGRTHIQEYHQDEPSISLTPPLETEKPQILPVFAEPVSQETKKRWALRQQMRKSGQTLASQSTLNTSNLQTTLDQSQNSAIGHTNDALHGDMSHSHLQTQVQEDLDISTNDESNFTSINSNYDSTSITKQVRQAQQQSVFNMQIERHQTFEEDHSFNVEENKKQIPSRFLLEEDCQKSGKKCFEELFKLNLEHQKNQLQNNLNSKSKASPLNGFYYEDEERSHYLQRECFSEDDEDDLNDDDDDEDGSDDDIEERFNINQCKNFSRNKDIDHCKSQCNVDLSTDAVSGFGQNQDLFSVVDEIKSHLGDLDLGEDHENFLLFQNSLLMKDKLNDDDLLNDEDKKKKKKKKKSLEQKKKRRNKRKQKRKQEKNEGQITTQGEKRTRATKTKDTPCEEQLNNEGLNSNCNLKRLLDENLLEYFTFNITVQPGTSISVYITDFYLFDSQFDMQSQFYGINEETILDSKINFIFELVNQNTYPAMNLFFDSLLQTYTSIKINKILEAFQIQNEIEEETTITTTQISSNCCCCRARVCCCCSQQLLC